jgi:hypothetical protein
MKLENCIKNLELKGYNLGFDKDNFTIQTKRGRVKVYIEKESGQSYCKPFKDGGQIFLADRTEEKEIERSLLHEREHFQILPYDFWSYGLITTGAIAYIMKESCERGKVLNGILGGLAILFYSFISGFNLYSDTIIGVRHKFGLDKKYNPNQKDL